MILLLSPAKTLDNSPMPYHRHDQARFLHQAATLINVLKTYDTAGIQELMKVSEKIATINIERYHSFTTSFHTENAKPAILTFRGDVYAGLEAWKMTEEELDFAQTHLRILSGLYGLLRPMDLMQPYRLEMGTRLPTSTGKNLYEFWGDKITSLINQDLAHTESDLIVNLASNEYFKAVQKKSLAGKLVHITFKDKKNETYKVIAFHAKKARGMMAKYIIQNRLTSLEALQGFHEANYTFSEEMSSEKELVFVR